MTQTELDALTIALDECEHVMATINNTEYWSPEIRMVTVRAVNERYRELKLLKEDAENG